MLAQGGSADGADLRAGPRAHRAHRRRGVEVVPDTAFKTGPPRPSRTSSTTCPASGRSRNGATMRGCRSAARVCRATSICAASSSTWTASRSTPSDGYGDFQEIDPTAYRYVEIFKGANALAVRRQFARRRDQLRDAERPRCQPVRRPRRRRQLRLRARAGEHRRRAMAARTTSSPARPRVRTAFRDHSWGDAERGNANVGYRISPDVETRFYLNGNRVRQRIPGEVTKVRGAELAAGCRRSTTCGDDWQRNIDTVRIANKTTMRFGDDHHRVRRVRRRPPPDASDLPVAGLHATPTTAASRRAGGRSLHLGAPQPLRSPASTCSTARSYQAVRQPAGGVKGALLSSSVAEVAELLRPMLENSFYVLPTLRAGRRDAVSLSRCASRRSLHAQRRPVRRRTLRACGTRRSAFCGTSIRPARCSATSRAAAEVPSFGENVAPNFLRPTCRAFRGTASRRRPRPPTRSARAAGGPTITWDVALYHADIRTSCSALLQSRSATATSPMRTARCTRASSSASAPRCGRRSGSTAPSPTASGSTSPTR